MDDLATALAGLPGLTITTPTAVTLASDQCKPPTDGTASAAAARVANVSPLPLGATCDLTPGEVDKVWILDVGGQRLVIDAPETPDQTTTTAEVQAILGSIRLEQLN